MFNTQGLCSCRWLDKTPTSRIIARCTQDIQESTLSIAVVHSLYLTLLYFTVDTSLARWSSALTELSLEMLSKLVVVVIISPIFLIPGACIAALGAWVGEIYVKAQLAVKRERSNAKAPVLGHLGAAFAGLSTSQASLAILAWLADCVGSFDSCVRCAGGIQEGVIQAYQPVYPCNANLLQSKLVSNWSSIDFNSF